MAVNLNPLVQKNVRLQGSFSHNWPMWERVTAPAGQRPHARRTVVGLRTGLDDWRDAFDGMHEGRVIKSVLSGGPGLRRLPPTSRMPSLDWQRHRESVTWIVRQASGKAIAQHFARSARPWSCMARTTAHGRRGRRRASAPAVGARRSSRQTCRTRTTATRWSALAVREFGGLDILVNNAADITRGTVESVPLALWDRILAVNLRAPFILLQAAIPHIQTRGGGSIVNIGSVNAYIGEPKLCPYSVSKGGLMTLTKNAASSLNQTGFVSTS